MSFSVIISCLKLFFWLREVIGWGKLTKHQLRQPNYDKIQNNTSIYFKDLCIIYPANSQREATLDFYSTVSQPRHNTNYEATPMVYNAIPTSKESDGTRDNICNYITSSNTIQRMLYNYEATLLRIRDAFTYMEHKT